MNYKAIDQYATYAAYCYVTAPALFFVIGWMKLIVALPIALGLLACLFLTIREQSKSKWDGPKLLVSNKWLLISFLFVALWLFMSGISGVTYQNEDHQYRNAIFSDLMSHNWPVTYHISDSASVESLQGKETMMAYYIGFWLPSAAVGKLLGVSCGKIFLYTWTLLGVLLIFYFTCRYLKKFSFPILLTAIFFGNVLMLPAFKYFSIEDVLINGRGNWTKGLLLGDSMHNGVYWVYNQYVIPILVLTLLLNRISTKNSLFIYSIVFFQGPFAFIGLAPILSWLALSQVGKKGEAFISVLKNHMSIQNIFGIIVLLPIFYLSMAGNTAAQNIEIIKPKLKIAIVFFPCAFMLIAAILFPKYKKEPLYYICIILLCIVPFIRIGKGADFALRASIPAMYVLMLFTVRLLIEEGFSKLKPLAFIYVCLSAMPSLLSLTRSVVYTVWNVTDHAAASKYLYDHSNIYHYQRMIGKKPEDDPTKNYLIQSDLGTLDNPANTAMANFMAVKEKSLFYKYLAKRER
jgi:hypothetical protein